MNKIFLVLLVFNTTLVSSQKAIQLDEIVIHSNVDYFDLLKKITKNLKKNCDTTTASFIGHFDSKINSKKMIDTIGNIAVKTFSFDSGSKFTKSSLLDGAFKTMNVELFEDCNDENPPSHWICNYPLVKNFRVLKFDFLNKNKDYNYKVMTDGLSRDILIFESDSLYNGKIIYDKLTKRPISISYESMKPYKFGYTSYQGLKFKNSVSSEWTYKVEKVLIEFAEFGKIGISNIEIVEEISDFVYKEFDKSKKNVYNLNCNFSSVIKLKRNEK